MILQKHSKIQLVIELQDATSTSFGIERMYAIEVEKKIWWTYWKYLLSIFTVVRI